MFLIAFFWFNAYLDTTCSFIELVDELSTFNEAAKKKLAGSNLDRPV